LESLTQESILARLRFLDDGLEKTALRSRIGRAVGHRDISFAELRELSAHAAINLIEQGAVPGNRVAVLMPHGIYLVAQFFGAILCGAVPCIIAWPTAKMDADKYRRNITTVVSRLQADFLVTDGASADALGSFLEHTTVIDPAASQSRATGTVLPPCPSRAASEPLFIQFSGGTTGAQKSVPISIEMLMRQLNAYASALALSPSDRIISWLPLYHDMGLIACLLLPFLYRLPLSMFAPMEWVMDPTPFLDHVGKDRSTLMWLPNFAFSFMANKVRDTSSLDLSTIRATINCSEPLREESISAFASRFASAGFKPSALGSCYAMAEATFALTQSAPEAAPRRLAVGRSKFSTGVVEMPTSEADRRVLVSSGKPLPEVEIRISGNGLGPGEIWVRAPFVMTGYLDESVPKSELFEDGFYRTGDVGLLHDGELFVTGRMKDLIIVGGVNVFPEDVEFASHAVRGVHPGRVVALGFSDRGAGTERLVVVAEVDDPAMLDEEATRIESDLRRAILSDCGVAPACVLLVPPKWTLKSTAGKISRSETRAKLLRELGENHLFRGQNVTFLKEPTE
jgi:fatty-acyl-CoA synthase